MNAHAIVWIGLFLILVGLTFRRSSWGIPLYMLTMYDSPSIHSWGWMLQLSGIRWSLTAALIFATAALLDGRKLPRVTKSAGLVLLLVFLFALDTSVVHFLFAVDAETSWEGVVLQWKLSGLVLLMLMAMKDITDVKMMVYSMVIGAAYLGYQVAINDWGSHTDGRVFVRIAGMHANHSTALLSMSLPLGAVLLLCGTKMEKLLAIPALAFTLHVVLVSNTRGVFLGLIAGAVWLVIHTTGGNRKRVIVGIVLGLLAIALHLDQEDRVNILGRFSTMFASVENRDVSAQSRMEFWIAGLEMLRDYPFGSGFEAGFESDLGVTYIRHLRRANEDEYRSVHNGYLSTAIAWGVQGLILRLAAIGLAWWHLRDCASSAHALGDDTAVLSSRCIEAVLIVLLFASMFSSTLQSEGFWWWIALAFSQGRLALGTSASSVEASAVNQAPAFSLPNSETLPTV